MFRLLFLCGVLLCVSLPAVAQDVVALDAGGSESDPGLPSPMRPSDREPWQLGAGFQFQHFGVLGQSFHTLAFSSDVTYYLNNWFGVEGTAVAGFGHDGSNPSIDAKSLFLGGGPHVVITNTSRFEPWFHVIVGLDHFRFTQDGPLGAETRPGFMAGGGVDYKLGGSAYWRVQGDFIGSRFGKSSIDKSFSIGTALVINF